MFSPAAYPWRGVRFEPVRANFQLLVTNVTLNEFANALPLPQPWVRRPDASRFGIDLRVPASSAASNSTPRGGEDVQLYALDSSNWRCAL